MTHSISLRAVWRGFFVGALLVAAIGFSMPSVACEIPLIGEALQGGLLIGRAQPGATVTVDGRTVRVAPDGLFLLGFGRDAAAPVRIIARDPAGTVTDCAVTPEKREYKITRIDGLPKRKVSPNPADMKRIRADNAAIARTRNRDTAATDFTDGFRWPLAGRISGVFGSQRVLNGQPRRPHNGVDIAAPAATPIAAPAPGVVALVEDDMFLTGKSVMLDHGHGLTSVYVHMSSIAVTQGQRLKRGDVIGAVGKTGRATGNHLHWGVTLFETHLDPALLAGEMNR